VISHERGKDREVFTTSGTYPWPFPKNSVWKVMKPLCRTNSFAQFFVLLFSFIVDCNSIGAYNWFATFTRLPQMNILLGLNTEQM